MNHTNQAYYLLGCFIKSAFLFNLFFVPLKILDHEILSGEFEMISVMVDSLSWVQMEVVQNVVDGVSLHPKDVPVLADKKQTNKSVNLP